jgi:Rho-binding antiterminator
MSQQILKCDLHDFVEIACLYKIKVMLRLQDGSHLTGVPITTSVGKDKIEYLSFSVTGKKSVALISLLDIKSMQARETNRYFDIITFDFE